jgi:hypothetical protein
VACHHRRVANATERGSGKEQARVLLYAPDAKVMSWIDGALDRGAYLFQVARTAREIVTILVDDPPPRPQVLVADFDAMSAGDVLGLHSIRDRGWFGAIVALGTVAQSLCSSLNINVMLSRPLDADVLRDAVGALGLQNATTRIPTIRR